MVFYLSFSKVFYDILRKNKKNVKIEIFLSRKTKYIASYNNSGKDKNISFECAKANFRLPNKAFLLVIQNSETGVFFFFGRSETT